MDEIPFEELDPGYAEDGSVLGSDFQIWYRSAAPTTEPLLAALRAAGADPYVEFVRVPLSLKDLIRAAHHVEERMQSQNLPVGVTIDTATGGVVLHPYAAGSSFDRGPAGRVVERSGLPYSWGDPPPAPYIRGGQYVDVGGNACTAGFVVDTPAGNRRVSSAGHCGQVGDHVTYNSASGWSVKARDYDAFHDYLTFDKPSQTYTATVQYSASGTSRDVTGTRLWSSMDVGDPVSKYGSSTGYTLGTISGKHACSPAGCDGESMFVSVNPDPGYAHMCSFGDSGGPVMYNTVAYGLVTGGSTATNCIFMPQQLMTPAVVTQ